MVANHLRIGPCRRPVHHPPGSRFASGGTIIRNTVLASGGGGGAGGSAAAKDGSVGDKNTWGGSNLGKDLPSPKEICKGLDKFVIGQQRAKKVLTEPKNALGKQYKKMFSMNDAPRFSWNEQDICYYLLMPCLMLGQATLYRNCTEIDSGKAMAKNTGARGLRAMLESTLTEAMYEMQKQERTREMQLVIDEDALGSVRTVGCGAKILRGDGALQRYLSEAKLKDRGSNGEVTVGDLLEGEAEVSSRAMSL